MLKSKQRHDACKVLAQSSEPVLCSTTSNLNNFKPQQLQPQKRVQNEKKKQNRRPQPRKHTKDPTLAPLFFGTMRLFLKFFGLHQRVPFHLFRYFATQWISKNRKGSPLLHFSALSHCSKISLKFFWEIFSCLQRVPSSIF